MIGRLLVAGALGAAVLVPGLAPVTEAHSDGAFCHGIFSPTAFGSLRPDGTRLGSGQGACVTGFGGLPVGVIGHYDAGDATAPAEIHVEVWAGLSTGQRMKLAECHAKGTGTIGCEDEDSTGQAVGLPEALPAAITRVDCVGHSHVNIKDGTTPVAQFGCYTSDAAEAALRAEMGL